MAKAKSERKLKVYWAEIDGLNEWIVAAPNRRAALDAFGVNQDLFAQDMAGEEVDETKTAQARAAPQTPLRRPKGSNDAFEPVAGVSDWSAAAPKVKGGAQAKARKPNRKALDKAEARLAEIEEAHRQARAAIDAERRRLDERADAEAERYEANAGAARERVEAETAAYGAAGGRG